MECLLDNKTWNDFFLSQKKELDKIATFLFYEEDILPFPDNIFIAFNLLNVEDIKVVILGQDPYINLQNNIPQATGLAFSVPDNFKIPPSLNNIFKNLLKFKHISTMPKHGNLMNWMKQGVFLLNSSLTVGNRKSNSHKKIWKNFTDNVIKYINDKNKKCVFVLWGAEALSKKKIITNRVIISSHPSGLSAYQKLDKYPSFNEQDHFGLINTYLEKKICWNN